MKIFAALLATLLWLSQTVSAEPTRIIGLILDYRLDKEMSSQYGLLLAEMKDMGFDYNLELYPLSRFWREIDEDRSACQFPSVISSAASVLTHIPPEDYIAADPIDFPTYRAIVRPGEPLITSLDQLAGKKVAGVLGFPNRVFVGDIDVDIEETNNEASRVRMLMSNRVDAVFAFVPDFHLAVDELGYEQVTSEGALQLIPNLDGTGLVCFDTPENRIAVQKFNEILATLKASGRLREIMGPYPVIK